MAIGRGLSGLDTVLRNLNREIERIERRSRAGMYRAVNIVGGQAKVYTPVDTSNLINSQYTDVIEQAQGITGIIGYTASYAMEVHEIDRNYRKPGSRWKYLETALFEKSDEVLEVLADEMRIPSTVRR